MGRRVEISELRRIFERGRPILFLGAGPSMAQDGPSGPQLATKIRNRFGATGDDFLAVCNDVIRYKGKRAELEQFIHDELGHLPVSRDFLELLALPWEFVLTTNYDLLPNAASGLLLEGGKRISLHDGREHASRRDPHRLHVFKILGSCDRRHPDTGFMQLSSTDFRMHYDSRRPYMQQLRAALGGRDLVLLGTSLGDELIFDFYDEMLGEPGPKPESQTFLVNPTPLEGRAKTRSDQLGIIYVEGSLRTLVESLKDLKGQTTRPEGRLIAARGKRFRISTELEDGAPYAGRFIDALQPGTVFGRKDEFYKRSAYSKEAFDQHWDFQREVRILGTKQADARLSLKQVRDRLHDARGEVPAAFALLGGPGSAKTMSALRIIHDWAAMGDWALLIDSKVDWFAPETTADFVEKIYREYLEFCDREKSLAQPPSLLVVLDNCADRMETVRALASKLRRAQIKNLVFLVTGHRSEFAQAEEASFNAVFELAAHVSETEIQAFRDFVSKTFPEVKEAFVNTILQDVEASTFWGMLYMVITSTQEPLELTVLKLYDQLPTWTQDLLATVATFQDLRLPAPEQMLLRKYEDLTLRHMVHEIEEGVLVDLVLRHQDNTVPTLACLNNTIAHLIYEKKVRPKHARHSDILVRAIGLAIRGTDEAEYLQDKFIERLSQERSNTLNRDEAERILRAVAQQFQNRPIYHHHAKSLVRIGKFEDAERELIRAQRDLLASERIENIHHSFGELYYKWARANVDKDRELARQMAAKARESYRTAKAGGPHYSAHGIAKLMLVEARLMDTDTERKGRLLEALRECDLGRAMSRGRIDKEMFGETRADILRTLAELAFTIEEARDFARRHRTGQGFVVLLENQLGRADLGAYADVAGALQTVNEGLTFAADDPALNLWKARLLFLLDEREVDQILRALKKHGGLLSKTSEMLFEAKVVGSNGHLHQAATLINNAARISPDPLLSIDHTTEDYLRSHGRIATFRVIVSKSKRPVIQCTNGEEFETSANAGDILRMIVTVRGLLPEILAAQPSIVGFA